MFRFGSHLQEFLLTWQIFHIAGEIVKIGLLLVPSILDKGCIPVVCSTSPFLFTGGLRNSTVKAEIQDPVTKVGHQEPQSKPLTPANLISTSKHRLWPSPPPAFQAPQGLVTVEPNALLVWVASESVKVLLWSLPSSVIPIHLEL